MYFCDVACLVVLRTMMNVMLVLKLVLPRLISKWHVLLILFRTIETGLGHLKPIVFFKEMFSFASRGASLWDLWCFAPGLVTENLGGPYTRNPLGYPLSVLYPMKPVGYF